MQKIIRLNLRGKKYTHMYDIVIIDKKSRNRSSFLMKLGFLNLKKGLFKLNFKKLGYFLNKGVKLHPNLKFYLSYFVTYKKFNY